MLPQGTVNKIIQFQYAETPKYHFLQAATRRHNELETKVASLSTLGHKISVAGTICFRYIYPTMPIKEEFVPS